MYPCVDYSNIILKRNSSNKLYFLTVNILGENLVNSNIQIVIIKQLLEDENNLDIIKKITLGDIIGITGNLGKTKVGEVSIFATKVILLEYMQSSIVSIFPRKIPEAIQGSCWKSLLIFSISFIFIYNFQI